jgi:hypothetical protein
MFLSKKMDIWESHVLVAENKQLQQAVISSMLLTFMKETLLNESQPINLPNLTLLTVTIGVLIMTQ